MMRTKKCMIQRMVVYKGAVFELPEDAMIVAVEIGMIRNWVWYVVPTTGVKIK